MSIIHICIQYNTHMIIRLQNESKLTSHLIKRTQDYSMHLKMWSIKISCQWFKDKLHPVFKRNYASGKSTSTASAIIVKSYLLVTRVDPRKAFFSRNQMRSFHWFKAIQQPIKAVDSFDLKEKFAVISSVLRSLIFFGFHFISGKKQGRLDMQILERWSSNK